MELEPTTCGPFYVDDRRKVEEEIVDAPKAQGYRRMLSVTIAALAL
jgi:hypothetical protein